MAEERLGVRQAMTSYVALLRGINVGGNKMVAMAELREMLAALGFADPKTLLQSGNAVFRCAAKPCAKLEALLEAETAKRLGVTCEYHVRTAAELRAAIEANPLKAEAKKDPSHLLVSFFKAPLDTAKVKAAQAAIAGPEIVRCDGRHLYMFYPAGIGNSKAGAVVDKALGVRGTARNWNTVLKLTALTDAP
jgi:uncharacterized protein (DUF1697 family)